MGQWDDLFGDFEGDKPKPRGLVGTDAGPSGRRVAAGLPPGPREQTSEQAGTMNAPHTVVVDKAGPIRTLQGGAVDRPSLGELGPAERQQAEAEAEADAGFAASMVIGGAAGKVAGPLVGGAVGKVAPKLAPLASGAGAGAAATAATGGSAADIAKGAALGAAFNLPAALEGVGTIMSKPSRDLGIVKDLTPYMDATTRQQARQIGYAKTAEAARRFGVVGAPDPSTANASVKAGSTAVGQEIGDVYDTIAAEHARKAGGFVSNVKRDTATMRGTRSGNAMADAIEAEAQRIQDLAGGTADSPMTLRNIRKELTDAQKAGYGGKKYEQLTADEQAQVERAIGRHLQAELDAGLAAAGADPRFASKVARIPELNATYRALQVLDETTGRMVDRQMMKQNPGIVARSSSAIHKGTLGALGKPMPEKFQPVTMPTGRRAGMGMTPGTPLDPGLTGALVNANSDPDGMKASLRSIFFGGGGDQ